MVPPNFFSDPQDLLHLNWPVIDSLKWSEPNDTLRHQRMAEALVHGALPLSAAVRCIVWNDSIKEKVDKVVAASGAAFPRIEFESPARRHYYTAFQENKKSSIVTGPREIAMIYRAACQYVANEKGKHSAAAAFRKLKDLLVGLRADFGCIPQTAELAGLRSANGIHKQTVDVHTQEVVARLRSLDEFRALSPKSQGTVELAAYLHDIGKGPRSRWDSNGGLQKVDPNHPVGAMPMMAEILVNLVAYVSQGSAETLLKLVCYHDLVGDVLGRGRDEQQIVDVASSEDELAMLFALGRADATVLVETWWDADAADGLYDRCLAAMHSG